ncbi:MAG: flagellar motor switch protein FliM [Bacillota bacterium]
MQEVLSQQEIDSLLAALTSGELKVEEVKREQAPAVRLYDFRRPNKFSKEHLRTLEMLHQQFARLLSSFLSGYLHVSVNVEVASVGQLIFEEFIRSLPSPSIMMIFGLKPLEGPAILEINAQVIYPMIDLLFGGPGTSAVENREPTDIELTVIRRLGARILENLGTSWQDFYQVAPEMQAIETNPRMQQYYAPNEVTALITFAISLNDEEKGLINLCLPYLLLEPLISQLSVRQQFVRRAGASRPEDVQRLRHWLGLAPLNLKVILGESEITVKELLGLQAGDVLLLERRYDQDLRLYVEEECKFFVQAGRVGENLAVQVTSLVEEEKKDV